MIPLLLREKTIVLIRDLANELGVSPELVVHDAMVGWINQFRRIDLERQKRATHWGNDPFDCQDEGTETLRSVPEEVLRDG